VLKYLNDWSFVNYIAKPLACANLSRQGDAKACTSAKKDHFPTSFKSHFNTFMILDFPPPLSLKNAYCDGKKRCIRDNRVEKVGMK